MIMPVRIHVERVNSRLTPSKKKMQTRKWIERNRQAVTNSTPIIKNRARLAAFGLENLPSE